MGLKEDFSIEGLFHNDWVHGLTTLNRFVRGRLSVQMISKTNESKYIFFTQLN